jgi:protein TonB
VVGPGTGRGGQGIGLGSGTQGSGTGGGGGGGLASRARWISGSIRESDYPRSAIQARKGGTVRLRFVVAPNGRVNQCTVTGSSGSAALDETTCTLIRSRFRYRPARDYTGRPVAETVRGEHEWQLGPEPPTTWVEPEIVDE